MEILWKLQNQRQSAAYCWPRNAARGTRHWGSGSAVCSQAQHLLPLALEAGPALRRAGWPREGKEQVLNYVLDATVRRGGEERLRKCCCFLQTHQKITACLLTKPNA